MLSHPLHDVELRIADFKGFGSRPTGFESFQPINVIIGRNNAGKSALIDAVELCIRNGKSYVPLKHARNGKPFQLHLTQTMDTQTLRQIFPENTSGGDIPGNHWKFAAPYTGKRVTRVFGPDWQPTAGDDEFSGMHRVAPNITKALMRALRSPFEGLQMIRIAAERDVTPEPRGMGREVGPNGKGTTNLVRAFLLSDDLPRADVEVRLLADLNEVYQGDSHFTQILVREDSSSQDWEIFLREDEKGDIRLSESGSSLKSIFILLATLRLAPAITQTDWAKVIFAIEEPENNLHPALLRRLLNFLATQRDSHGFTLLITTHSPVCIDWSTKRDNSQILHVQHRQGETSVRTAIEYNHSRDILNDLDVRASDILQANGIIWVEGPSDRIYIKKWIELISQQKLIEGVHFTVMFYGGKLLSHFDALPPNQSHDLVSFMSLNRNAALLMDSDRHLGGRKTGSGRIRKPRIKINGTKLRIKEELERIGGFVWITEGREVENYISERVIAELGGVPAFGIGIYEDVPAIPALSRYKENKVALAHAAVEKMTLADLRDRLDLHERLVALAAQVRAWNAIPDA
ncbi:ATP-dependent nuclease [Sphingobium sp. SYK-6]|uniref:ATP-dependent nuclease n=1 Tax=Sphingobium sp. (strain NBRC 103272 / SYK-6) TaxID=627192 RepID=UPI001314CE31|nr:ATP-binding protein [Sphingobium sp. SYK-6]